MMTKAISTSLMPSLDPKFISHTSPSILVLQAPRWILRGTRLATSTSVWFRSTPPNVSFKLSNTMFLLLLLFEYCHENWIFVVNFSIEQDILPLTFLWGVLGSNFSGHNLKRWYSVALTGYGGKVGVWQSKTVRWGFFFW